MTKCPQCGYTEVFDIKKLSNEMSVYVNNETGKVDGVFNSTNEYLTVKGVKLRRQDILKEVSVMSTKPVEKK